MTPQEIAASLRFAASTSARENRKDWYSTELTTVHDVFMFVHRNACVPPGSVCASTNHCVVLLLLLAEVALNP